MSFIEFDGNRIMNYAYPAHFEWIDVNEVVVTFPDFPEALTGASTKAEALDLAADALDEVVLHRLAADERIPLPATCSPGDELVALDPRTAVRVMFARVLAERELTKVAAAEAIGVDERQIRRILDGRGKVRMESVLDALRALGRRPVLADLEAA